MLMDAKKDSNSIDLKHEKEEEKPKVLLGQKRTLNKSKDNAKSLLF